MPGEVVGLGRWAIALRGDHHPTTASQQAPPREEFYTLTVGKVNRAHTAGRPAREGPA